MIYSRRQYTTVIGRLFHAALHGVLVILGAALFASFCFLVLPLLQAIAKGSGPDRMVTGIDAAALPPPPPPPVQEEPEEEEEDEPEPPPQLDEPSQLMDIAQLELALNPGGGSGWAAGNFGISLEKLGGGGADDDALFSLDDLDQRPRPIYQPSPRVSPALQRKAPATVYVLFVVGPDGRVEDPVVQRSTDPAFDRAAVDAVRKWKFEPGKRSGKPVRFRVRQQITFPKS